MTLFKREMLQELTDGFGDEAEIIKDEVIEHTRWSVVHELIFKKDDKFYVSHYSIGATENQDESAYEYDDAEIECTEVFPVEKTVIVYEVKS